MISVTVTFCCFIFLLILSIVYFSKKRIDNIDNKIFSTLLVINLIGICIDLLGFFSFHYFGTEVFFNKFISKIFLIYFITYGFILMMYIYNYTFKKENHLKILTIIFSFLCLIDFFLPIKVHFENSVAFSYGVSVGFAYFLGFLIVMTMVFCLIKNIRNIRRKEFIPLLSFVFFLIVTLAIQMTYPQITLLNFSYSVVTFIMYFTIENPDMKMIDELQVARDQAEKANHAKTDFLSSMSHEIRTPLNAIVGFSDCIMDANTLDEAKENAHDIISASQTLLEIVNGILDISKIEAGKIEIVNSPYNAVDTFTELAKLITPKMNEKGLDFSYNIAADIPETLYGDHANLKKIVTNLLSNACKYTDRGFVHYEVNCVNSNNVSKLIISVEDSGRGIKKENIDKMFTKFQRIDEDKNSTIEGTGLGLAITKQLIELMGGRIIVHTVYGEGSKFTIVLNQKIEKTVIKEEKKVRSTLDLRDVKILLVDDTLLNLKVACKLLEKYNANMIDTCSSGFECIDRIKSGKVYDLILLDDMMPKMSGVTTLKRLKEDPNFNIPTIALTANAITGMREKYLADGFNDYLAKPIEKEQLIRVVNQVLGRSATEELDKIPVKTISVNSDDVGDALISVDTNPDYKNLVIPVTDEDMNMDEVLSKTTELKKVSSDSVETLDENVNGNSTVNTNLNINNNISVNVNSSISSEVYDRSYLEKNGADINHALELLGDMEMYNMTIQDFVSEIDEKWNRIIEYKNSNNMPDYAIEVHSLKSDCKYLGFMGLADIAYEHELKSKENDSNFVNSNFGRLETEYNRVVAVIKTYAEHNPVSEDI